jgi:hypothetical protein
VAWPLQPTVIDPTGFRDTAAALLKLFTEAHVTLARIKARRPQKRKDATHDHDFKIAALVLTALLTACSSGAGDRRHVRIRRHRDHRRYYLRDGQQDGAAAGGRCAADQGGGDDRRLRRARAAGIRLRPGDRVYLSAQNAGESGSLTCRIYSNSVYGVIISENISRGAFAGRHMRGPDPNDRLSSLIRMTSPNTHKLLTNKGKRQLWTAHRALFASTWFMRTPTDRPRTGC